jgi:very-short-patch-repair endonuclease/phage FluMu protein Com
MKLFDIISEDVDLDEMRGKNKTDEEWLDLLKSKFPNWNFDNAILYRRDGRFQIKNVYCNKHQHFFPEENKSEGIQVQHMLKRSTGCYDCGIERKRQSNRREEGEWKKTLMGYKKFKNKCDFKDITFSNDEKNNIIVNNIYCKVHNKYFGGIKAQAFAGLVNPCPKCAEENKFEMKATSLPEWIKKFKSNKRNKNYDYSKTKVYYEKRNNENSKSEAYVYNINCNVKGLNGKKHGLYAKNGALADSHVVGYAQCPKCECENKQKDFIEKAIEQHGDKYLYDKVDFCDSSSIDDNSIRKILIGCKTHGYFFQNPYKHRSGQGCPICRESKGENYINSFLISKYGSEYKILREKDATFEKLVGKKFPLPFDFYIPELKVLIEYDGEQHFWPVFGSSDANRNRNYNITFDNDNIKNNWVKSKSNNLDGIRLIRVPYTMEFNDIDRALVRAIKDAPPNSVYPIGDYPRRHGRKEPQSKFQIKKPLSLFEIVKEIN